MSAALYVSEELRASVRRMCSSPCGDLAKAYEDGQVETLRAAARNRTEMAYQWPGRRWPTRQRRKRSLDAYERRHRLAWSGPLPGFLAGRLTIGDVAVARIIADEHIRRRFCDLSMEEIADRAGVCRKTAQRAMRRMRGECLITVQERPVKGRKNLTNVAKIVSRDWLCWIEKRSRSSIGRHLGPTTDTTLKKEIADERKIHAAEKCEHSRSTTRRRWTLDSTTASSRRAISLANAESTRIKLGNQES